MTRVDPTAKPRYPAPPRCPAPPRTTPHYPALPRTLLFPPRTQLFPLPAPLVGMSYDLPNPSLVGILLVVSTHNGPHVVFHYPPELGKRKLARADPDEDTQSDDDFDDEDYEQADLQEPDTPASTADDPSPAIGPLFRFADGGGASVESQRASVKDTTPATSRVLGFEPEILAEMLSPPREMFNSRFDVTLEDMVFVGLPVHVQPVGSWKPRKTLSHTGASECAVGPGVDVDDDGNDGGACGGLNMFHLVFAMEPPKLERSYRTDEMFYYVILKLLLILRHEQYRRNYVWEQVVHITRLKEREAKRTGPHSAQLCDALVAELPLCRMIQQCYAALVASRIAHLDINNKLHSFQIPLQMEFHSLPDVTTPYVAGSYLSSTTSFLGDSGLVAAEETTRYSTRSLEDRVFTRRDADDADDDLDDDLEDDDILHLGLLLWDDPSTIIHDIKARPNSPIAMFIKLVRPTEPLSKVYTLLQQQLAGQSNLHASHIRDFALHLVHWRKARIIPPITTRAVYIVSPMAPVGSRFHHDVARFHAHFPTIPCLPLFLKSLSTRATKSRQFASIIPSKDHRDLYLQALAWLVRNGYATQLHTYLWLKVSRRIKMKVEEDLEAELGCGLKRGANNFAPADSRAGPVDNSSKEAGAALNDEIDQLKRPLEGEDARAPDFVMEDDSDTILIDPGRASSLERRWINEIIHKECALLPELTAVFYKLLKYMNGRSSLEILLLKENITRAELRKLLVSIEAHVISVRHW